MRVNKNYIVLILGTSPWFIHLKSRPIWFLKKRISTRPILLAWYSLLSFPNQLVILFWPCSRLGHKSNAIMALTSALSERFISLHIPSLVGAGPVHSLNHLMAYWEVHGRIKASWNSKKFDKLDIYLQLIYSGGYLNFQGGFYHP